MHPVFNALRYPFNNPLAFDLFTKLYTLYPSILDIQLKYQQYGIGLPPLNTTQPPRDLWLLILDDFTKAGLLQAFCEGMITDPLIHPQLKAAFESVIAAPSDVDKVFINDKVMVFDRIQLREHLKLLSDPAHPQKVLLVRGETKSGKSYGRHIFLSVAKEKGATPLYLSHGMIVTVQDVFEELFITVASGENYKVPAKDTTDEAWYGKICRELRKLAVSNDLNLWIAIDDLGADENSAPLDPDIKHFFDQFVLLMANPAFSDRFRLMLIHYPEGKLPSKWKQEICCEDRTSQQDVQQVHIESVLKSWCAKNNFNMTDEQMAAYSKDIIAAADQPDPNEEFCSRIERIHARVQQLFKDLLNSAA